MSTPRIEGMMGHRLIVVTLRQKLARHRSKTPILKLPYNRAALVEEEVKDKMHWALADSEDHSVSKLLEIAQSQAAPPPVDLDLPEPETEPEPLQVATKLLEAGKLVLFAAAEKAAPPGLTLPKALDAPQSTETIELRDYQMQLTKEWQTYHSETYAKAYLKMAFLGFVANLEYRKACINKTVPKAKHKIRVGNHKLNINIEIEEWAELSQNPTLERRLIAKLDLREYKQLNAMHWYTV